MRTVGFRRSPAFWPLICVFRLGVTSPGPPERTTREWSLSWGEITQTRTTVSGCVRGGQEETSAKVNNSVRRRRPQIAHAAAYPPAAAHPRGGRCSGERVNRVNHPAPPVKAQRGDLCRRIPGPFRPGSMPAGSPDRTGRRPAVSPARGTAGCGRWCASPPTRRPGRPRCRRSPGRRSCRG